MMKTYSTSVPTIRHPSSLALTMLLMLIAAHLPAAEPSSPEVSRRKLPPVDQFESPRRLSLKTFRSYVEKKSGVVLDARSETEYRKGHVKGALSLPMEGFEDHYERLKAKLESDKAQPIVVYCSNFSCQASDIVQKKLMALGFTQVSIFPNGWAAWKTAQLPEDPAD